MKDNDFLDDLYSNSAKDVPPESLDQAILKHARDNVQKGNFLMRRQWQQFLSLAAVMVLSVYVVLDVGDQSRDVDGLSLSEEASEFIEPSPSGNELRAKAESFKGKEAKRMARDELMPLSVQQFSSDQVTSVQANEQAEVGAKAEKILMARPEEMLKEIEGLINEGNLVNAKIILQQLSDTYPEYPVPTRIVDALK
jgi:hypothetical protein